MRSRAISDWSSALRRMDVEMKRISVDELQAVKVAELGLDSTALDLTSPEALAASLRRSAGFLCPCPARTLVRSVARSMGAVVPTDEAFEEQLEVMLEAMLSYGDLLEHRELTGDPSDKGMLLIYAAPPSFVLRMGGDAILLGIAPEQANPLPDYLASKVVYTNHVRRIGATSGENLKAQLLDAGMLELTYVLWQKAPRSVASDEHMLQIDRRLDLAPPAGGIPGLILLDYSAPVRYYRGRWVEAKKQTGRFVARRPQAYGAAVWCYVQLRDGHPEKIVDLPLSDSEVGGCDEAWWLQMAVDAYRGKPQEFEECQGPVGTKTLKFFSPVPKWARRRWDAIGEPVPYPGCLFAYKFFESDVAEESAYCRTVLWLAHRTAR